MLPYEGSTLSFGTEPLSQPGHLVIADVHTTGLPQQQGAVLSTQTCGGVHTDTCWPSAVPLGQCVGHCLTPDGTGTMKSVTWVTLEKHHRAQSKVIPNALPVARLGHGAALGSTSPRNSCRNARR